MKPKSFGSQISILESNEKFVHTVANHSLLAISKLVSIVTESGKKLIQVYRHPPVGLRLKEKRGIRRMR